MQDFGRRQIASVLKTFSARLNRVAETGDPEDIHDLRVAIRRLSRALRVFGSWKPIRAQLRHGMQLAGAVRDRDIALELLEKAGVSPRTAVVRRLIVERRQANQEFLAEMRRWQEQQIVRQWSKSLRTTQGWSEPAPGFLTDRTAEYFARVRGLLAGNPRPKELHAARLLTKQFRYTLELFRSQYGTGLETRIDSLRKVQQLLGDVNDSVASRRLLKRLSVPFPERKRVQSYLKEKAIQDAAGFRKEWQERFDAPGREDWWTGYLKKIRKPT